MIYYTSQEVFWNALRGFNGLSMPSRGCIKNVKALFVLYYKYLFGYKPFPSFNISIVGLPVCYWHHIFETLRVFPGYC